MAGVVTRRHFFLVWREFGFRAAWRVLRSPRGAVALLALMDIR